MIELEEVIEPAFQPVYDFRQGKVAFYEALLRIRDDALDAKHIEYITLGERFGFIHQIDILMMKQAVRLGMLSNVRIALNLSMMTVENAGHEIISILKGVNGYGSQVILEFTETLPVKDFRIVANFLEEARGCGAKIAIDDYGALGHYFTDSLIKLMRPDYIKIDGAVLNKAVVMGNFAEIQHVIKLCRASGAELIAEFVDTWEKVNIIFGHDITHAQGYLIGVPVRNDFVLSPRFLSELGSEGESQARVVAG
ncbi:MAG: EAL domain-containing protein [Pseudomonadota bacterium]|nr:EAL domain-containing protein [Pseudomonadota bacterium]